MVSVVSISTCFIFILVSNHVVSTASSKEEESKEDIGKVEIGFSDKNEEKSHCQRIKVDLCSQVGYNQTMLPNNFSHETQEEIEHHLNKYAHIVQVNCSKDLIFFLCTLYLPICIEPFRFESIPCRSMCERTKKECVPILSLYGYSWPSKLECSKFPTVVQDVFCFDSKAPELGGLGVPKITEHMIIKPITEPKTEPIIEKKKSRQPVTKKPITRPPPVTEKTEAFFPVTKNTKVYKTKKEKVSIESKLALKKCCLYNEGGKLRRIITWLAYGCLFCSMVAIITCLLDSNRFPYPGRSIVYLSLCYFMVSIGLLIKNYFRGSFCGEVVMFHRKIAYSLPCVTSFVLTYLFGMAASIWWTILTLTWLFEINFKWTSETLANLYAYFHMFAWMIPSIKTIIILLNDGIETEEMTGICFVSNDNLLYFVIIPLFVYLTIGLLLFCLGVISTRRASGKVQKLSVSRVNQLMNLMFRISIFSFSYMVLILVYITCISIEHFYRGEWRAESKDKCSKRVVSLEFFLYSLKYISYLIAGIAAGLWILSSRSLASWIDCFKRYHRLMLSLRCNNTVLVPYHFIRDKFLLGGRVQPVFDESSNQRAFSSVGLARKQGTGMTSVSQH